MSFPPNWPIYYAKLLTLGNLESTVGIATLWTKKEFFVNKLDKNSYAVVGQLYSKLGINFMLRNIFANPKIRHLVVCGSELSGSGAELVKFWETGESNVIDKEIPKEDLDLLRKEVTLINLVGSNDIELLEQKIKELDQALPHFAEPKTFPEAVQIGPDQYPSDVSGFKVRGDKIATVWAKLMSMIMKFGEKKFTDEYEIREVINTIAVIENEDPKDHFIPDWFPFTKEEVDRYVASFQNGNPDLAQHYTYGNRMRQYFGIDQIKWIKDRLKIDPNAREAVASLIDPLKDLHPDGHRPCVSFVQAIKQRNKLHLNIYVRSHDMFSGWPQNAFGFLHLQDEIAKEACIDRGVLTIISASAHIYEYDWEKAREIGKKYFEDKPPCQVDPYGNFIVELDRENMKIICHHQSPEGLPVTRFDGDTAEEIMMAITKAHAISIPQHAMDLGRQLYKAELALYHNLEFTQDQPLDFGLLDKSSKYFKGKH